MAIKWSFISDHFFFQEGPGVRSVQYTDVGVKLLNVGNLEKNKLILENTERRISYETASNEYKHFMVDEGDLLIACSGIAARYFDEKIAFARSEHLPLCMNTSTMRFKAKSKHVLLEYLYHYLRTHRFKKEIAMVLTGSAQFNFGPSHVEKLKFPLIEIIDQRNISFFLSAIDRLIEKQKEKVDRIKSLKKGYLQKMFPANGENQPEIRIKGFHSPWLSKKLGEMGTTYTGLQGKSSEDFGHGTARYITYMNVFSNSIASNTQVESVEVDTSQNQVKYGDVFFTTSSETPEEVGMTSVWLNNQPNTYLNSFCFGFRPSTKFNPYFLGYLLRSPTTREKLIFLAQGISRYNISKTRVMEIPIQFPNLIEQEKIGSFLSAIDRLIEQEESAIERYESLKKGYLQKIFAD